MQQWEYKILSSWPSERDLNDLGMQGWELVTAATISAPMVGDQIRVFLKRARK